MPNQELPSDPIAPLVPDLVIETLNDSNPEEEMRRKLNAYFEAGSKLVWLVETNEIGVRVFSSPQKLIVRMEPHSLNGGKVLPGFSLPLKKWFQRASRKPRT